MRNRTLQQSINHLRRLAARAIAPPALLPEPLKESIHICGLIRARELPFETREEWQKWWLGEFDCHGKMIRAPRMSEREKERYTAAACENILVAGGITQLLTYLGSGNSNVFAQQFAVGNVAINQVESNDTSLANEFFRSAPSQANVSGVQQDLSTFVGTSQAVGNITNAGLFGVNATGTIGSGTLMTHSLFQYNKVNGLAVTFDYLLSYV